MWISLVLLIYIFFMPNLKGALLSGFVLMYIFSKYRGGSAEVRARRNL